MLNCLSLSKQRHTAIRTITPTQSYHIVRLLAKLLSIRSVAQRSICCVCCYYPALWRNRAVCSLNNSRIFAGRERTEPWQSPKGLYLAISRPVDPFESDGIIYNRDGALCKEEHRV